MPSHTPLTHPFFITYVSFQGVTFGSAIQETKMVRRSLRNELIGGLIALFIGMLVGLFLAPFYGPGGITADWASTEVGTPFLLLYLCFFMFVSCVCCS
jgi:hypothetical protein